MACIRLNDIFLPAHRAAGCRKEANTRVFAGFRKGAGKVSGVMSNKSTSEKERKGVEGGGDSSGAVQN